MIDNFVTAITAGALATGLGTALALPATRKLVLGNINQDWLQDELDFDRFDPDGCTVICKDSSFFRVFRIGGIAYEARESTEQENLCDVRTALIQDLAKTGMDIRFFGIKRRRDLSVASSWPSDVLTTIGEAEARRFKTAYMVDWFVVLSGKSYQKLEEADRKLVSGLGNWHAEKLYRESGDRPCRLTAFLQNLICGDMRDRLSARSDNISRSLPVSDLFGERGGVIRTQTPRDQVQKILSVHLWPDSVNGEIIDGIMSLPGEIEICQIALPWKNAGMVLARQLREKEAPFLGNVTEAGEIAAVLELHGADRIALFQTQFQITVRGPNEKAVDGLLEQIGGLLGHKRISYSIETGGAMQAWFNRMPGGGRRLLRPLAMDNNAIAALWAFRYAPQGRMYSPWGEQALRLFPQASGQAFAFQFHVYTDRSVKAPLGHYLVFAPSGSGKSTALAHMLGGMARFPDTRSYIFDSKEGMKFTVNALGGQYLNIDDLSLNIFDRPDNEKSRRDARNVIRSMVGHVLESRDEIDNALEEIKRAVDIGFEQTAIQGSPVTLTDLWPVGFDHAGRVKRALQAWVTDPKGTKGIYHDIFNGDHDALGGLLRQSFMTGINMNEFLEDPILGPAVVTHIATAIEEAAKTSGGVNIFVDEAANLLRNEGFKDVVAVLFRELRKLNGVVGLAFQDPEKLNESGIASAIVDNTATFMFFPNSKAKPEKFAPFNLNEEQFNFIRRGSEKGKRQVLIIQRDAATGFDESAIVDLNLNELVDRNGRDVKRFYQVGNEANALLADLQDQWGASWHAKL